MSPEQCRAARAWLNWSQQELAAKAQISNSTLRDFEAGRRTPIANNLQAIRHTLEDAGIEFLFLQGTDEPWGVAKRSNEGAERKSRQRARRG
jgi:transcriptional regulator with XRE-family HTH domain